jgi:hypothetical protein
MEKKSKVIIDASKKMAKISSSSPSTSPLQDHLPEHECHSFSLSSEIELDEDFSSKRPEYGGVLEVAAPEWWQEETLIYAMGRGKYQLADKRLLSVRLWKPQAAMIHKYLWIQVAQHKTQHKTVVLTTWGNSGVGRIPSRSEDLFEGRDAKEKAIEKFKSIFSYRTGCNFDSPPEFMKQSSYQVYTTESPKITELENIRDPVLPMPLPGLLNAESSLPPSKFGDDSLKIDVEAAAVAASLALFSPKTKKKPKRVRDVISDDEDEKVLERKVDIKSLHPLSDKNLTTESLYVKVNDSPPLAKAEMNSKPNLEKLQLKKQKTASTVPPISLHVPSTLSKHSSPSLPLIASSPSLLSSKAFASRLCLPQQQEGDENVVFVKSSLSASVINLIHSCVSNGAISNLVAKLGISARKLNLGGDALIAIEKASSILSDIAALVLARGRNEFDDESMRHVEKEEARKSSLQAVTEKSRDFFSLIPLSTSSNAAKVVPIDLVKSPSSWTSLAHLDESEKKDGIATTFTPLDSFSALSAACRVVDLLVLLNSSASAVLNVRRQQSGLFTKQEAAGRTIKKLPNSADLLLQTSLSWIEPLNEQQLSFLTLKSLLGSYHISVASAFACNLHSEPTFPSSLDSKLLWFTAPKCSLPGILSSGIPSPSCENPVSGYPYGKGIYLSFSPLAAYMAARKLEPTESVHLYLVEVGEDKNVRKVETCIHEDTSKVTVMIQGKKSSSKDQELRLKESDEVVEIVAHDGDHSVRKSKDNGDESEAGAYQRDTTEERVCEFLCVKKDLVRIRYLLVCNE